MGRLLKEMVILGIAVFAAIYLIFPTLGWIELIPDAIPIFGSIDEASATIILINTARYYGFDLTRLYGKRDQTKQLTARTPQRPQSLPE